MGRSYFTCDDRIYAREQRLSLMIVMLDTRTRLGKEGSEISISGVVDGEREALVDAFLAFLVNPIPAHVERLQDLVQKL